MVYPAYTAIMKISRITLDSANARTWSNDLLDLLEGTGLLIGETLGGIDGWETPFSNWQGADVLSSSFLSLIRRKTLVE